jgi:FMN phosphatase YigB (HAD superfamily)
MLKRTDIDWIFFDIGGVLTDDRAFEAARDQVIIEAVSAHAAAPDAERVRGARRLASSRTGELTANIIAELVADDGVRLRVQTEADELWRERAGDRRHLSPVRPEAGPVLERLATCYRLGIMANQPTRTKEKLLGAGILHHFSHAGMSEDYGFHKPDPQLFREVLHATGATAARSVMIDDNLERGLLPAKKLGFRIVWFVGDKTATAKDKMSADWIITELEDLDTIFC